MSRAVDDFLVDMYGRSGMAGAEASHIALALLCFVARNWPAVKLLGNERVVVKLEDVRKIEYEAGGKTFSFALADWIAVNANQQALATAIEQRTNGKVSVAQWGVKQITLSFQ